MENDELQRRLIEYLSHKTMAQICQKNVVTRDRLSTG